MIAIPNMEKPKECYLCEFTNGYECWSNGEPWFDVKEAYAKRTLSPNCPLIDIVQCKDCKYWHDHEWSSTCDKHIGHGFPSDYFCADGKRRTDGNKRRIV